ncbi:unnamed protein product [Vitrella brassicaformis CCMP3155]|uniref:Uncharacterized protein n=1 Tax=Vitrella brassicaformis (strain CCMP3155) TaxID=1169540 RepID=A0A0G4FVT0_VITBC|nr:unnamed protein product [Vitrella brassicaformis CCMP3155]|eukprot:CEM19279.1 unnamed protein product [Vitrella brassicaformis CCMP3155]
MPDVLFQQEGEGEETDEGTGSIDIKNINAGDLTSSARAQGSPGRPMRAIFCSAFPMAWPRICATTTSRPSSTEYPVNGSIAATAEVSCFAAMLSWYSLLHPTIMAMSGCPSCEFLQAMSEALDAPPEAESADPRPYHKRAATAATTRRQPAAAAARRPLRH